MSVKNLEKNVSTVDLSVQTGDMVIQPNTLYRPIDEDDQEWLKKFIPSCNEHHIQSLQQHIDQDIPDMRHDYDSAIRQHIITNRQAAFDILGIGHEAFIMDETSHPLARTVATLRYYYQLGLDAAKVVNTLPAALGYNPESVQAKMVNLSQLGLDAAKVVNTLPAALSYNPSKITIAAYSLMKAGLWETNGTFEGYKARLNHGEATDIFILPIESLLLFLHNKRPDHSKGLRGQVCQYMKTCGITSGTERKEAMMESLLDKDSREKMGYLAVVYALKEKLEIEF